MTSTALTNRSRAESRVSRDDANVMMQDKSWMIDMKAEIMRRAQEPSDDETEEAEYDAYGERIVRKQRVEPFEDDAWDGLDEGLAKVKVAGDGEATDESDGQEDTVSTPRMGLGDHSRWFLAGTASRSDTDNPRTGVSQGSKVV